MNNTRQGGASGVSISKDSGGLRFETQDDAINFGIDLTERGNNWLASNNLNVAERYLKGDLHVVLSIRADAEPHIPSIPLRAIAVRSPSVTPRPERLL